MNIEIIILFILFPILIALRLPIGFTLLLVGFLGFTILRGFGVAVAILPQVLYEQTASFTLIVVPLFIITGAFAFQSGLVERAYELAQRWMGKMRGGLAAATVVACAIFGACTGSSIATSLTIGRVSIPEMRRLGHSDAITCGTVAASGTLGMLIPPSGMLVIYGVLTEQPIGKLLIAGVVPGVLSALIYVAGVYLFALFRPQSMPSVQSSSWKDRFSSIYKAWGIFALFLSIIGGIYSGIFTVTEAAGLGAFVAFIMLMVKQDRWNNIKKSFYDGAHTTATIFLLLLGAFIFSRFIVMSGFGTEIAEMITGLPFGRYGILFMILLFYIPLGMFLDPLSMMLIILPVVFTSVTSLGFDPVWFGIISIKMAELANITPPMGLHCFVVKGIAPDEVRLEEIFKGCGFFVILDILTIVLLVVFPQIALWLPSTMLH